MGADPPTGPPTAGPVAPRRVHVTRATPEGGRSSLGSGESARDVPSVYRDWPESGGAARLWGGAASRALGPFFCQ